MKSVIDGVKLYDSRILHKINSQIYKKYNDETWDFVEAKTFGEIEQRLRPVCINIRATCNANFPGKRVADKIKQGSRNDTEWLLIYAIPRAVTFNMQIKTRVVETNNIIAALITEIFNEDTSA